MGSGDSDGSIKVIVLSPDPISFLCSATNILMGGWPQVLSLLPSFISVD